MGLPVPDGEKASPETHDNILNNAVEKFQSQKMSLEWAVLCDSFAGVAAGQKGDKDSKENDVDDEEEEEDGAPDGEKASPETHDDILCNAIEKFQSQKMLFLGVSDDSFAGAAAGQKGDKDSKENNMDDEEEEEEGVDVEMFGVDDNDDDDENYTDDADSDEDGVDDDPDGVDIACVCVHLWCDA